MSLKERLIFYLVFSTMLVWLAFLAWFTWYAFVR
jgi:hypothetical protein